MIRAIIFDCFGVLVADGWHPFKHRYFKDDPEKDDEASKLGDLSNNGSINYEQFLQQIGELAGLSARQVGREISQNAPNIELFEYIDSVKGKYKIGMLSNAASNWLDELFTPEQLDVFDGTVLSFDIGVNKPGKEAYIATAKKLGCRPEECVFIDDIQLYVEAAKAIGMHAIQYTNPKQTISDINSLISDVNN